jgi:polar amino acid transport system substrate-binding protein
MQHTLRYVLAGLMLALLAACGAGTSGTTAGTASTPGAASGTDAGTTAGTTPEATSGTDVETTSGPAGGLPDLGGRTVVVGTDATYPPFESVDTATNQIVGFDVDLMNEIAKLINIKPEFKNADFKTIFTALDAKQFDAVMSAATITEERKQVVNFSEPYIEVGQLVVTGANNDTIKAAQDLANGAIVGVQTGTTGEEAARTDAKVPDDKLKRYDTIDLAFADLANNSIDAVVADGPTVGNYTTQPQYQAKLKIVGEPFTTEQYGIAVNKADTELLNGINAALTQIKSGNTIQQLKDKYKIK